MHLQSCPNRSSEVKHSRDREGGEHRESLAKVQTTTTSNCRTTFGASFGLALLPVVESSGGISEWPFRIAHPSHSARLAAVAFPPPH